MELPTDESVTEGEEMEICGSKSGKRSFVEEENNEEEWKIAGKNKKLCQEEGSKLIEGREESRKAEIYISSQELMPKQFALARLLKDLRIPDIQNIKYLNPYKIRIQFKDEKSMECLISNESIKNKGWRINKLSEVSDSFGVIKDVDLDLSEEEIMNNITCPESVELISLRRLDRRNRDKDSKDKKWSPSESVRLCFKGSYLPTFVYVHDVKVLVDPYVYPVTQCFLCWKLGHTVRTCTIKKEVCPKCSGDHANCDTKIFKCVNCSGNHMAMTRTCPAYLKEKTIRDIMAEYNYTYSRAAQMYAASPIIKPAEVKRNIQAKMQLVTSSKGSETVPQQKPLVIETSCYTKDASDVRSEKSVIIPTRQQKKKSKKKATNEARYNIPEWDFMVEEEIENEKQDECDMSSDERQPDKVTITELLSRIKKVMFLKDLDFQTKVKSVIRLCVEWIIVVAVDNVSDWSIFKLFYGLFNLNG